MFTRSVDDSWFASEHVNISLQISHPITLNVIVWEVSQQFKFNFSKEFISLKLKENENKYEVRCLSLICSSKEVIIFNYRSILAPKSKIGPIVYN